MATATKKRTATETVFVYGSLLSGLGNHGLLREHGAELIGAGATEERYVMASMVGFPGCHTRGAGTPIRGEVYAVGPECFAALDRLEGFPQFYTRERVCVRVQSGEAIVAWMYVLARRDGLRWHETVEDGDWRAFYTRTRGGYSTAFDAMAADEPECVLCGEAVDPSDELADEDVCSGCARYVHAKGG